MGVNMRFKKVVPLIMITLLIVLLVGCGKKSKVNTDEVKSFSDPILESMLIASNKDDFAAYSKDFGEIMKQKFSEDAFKAANKLIKEKIGDYKSKEFVKAQTQGDYVSAIYKAKYSNEPKDVMISITFNKNDKEHMVEGIYLTSPKLAGK
jgi:hypothetical protein